MTEQNLQTSNPSKVEPQELARSVVNIIEEMKGEDIVLIDIQELTHVTDYFIVCTSDNERQAKAIVDRIREDIKEAYHLLPWQIEGTATGGWILMDYGHVVVHVFDQDQRDYYDLEGLWQAGRVLLRIQ
ncbi:MAG: ribosome silencing factor [Phototrophicales bacterium]|nr:MAG: ribosome silencing factor [Phototrophicales bacterium]